MGMRKDEPFNMFVDKDIQDVYPRSDMAIKTNKDYKKMWEEIKKILENAEKEYRTEKDLKISAFIKFGVLEKIKELEGDE